MPDADRDFTGALVEDVTGMRIGIPRDYFGAGLEKEVETAETTVQAVRKMLAEQKEAMPEKVL